MREFHDVDEAHRVYSSDRTRAASWYISREHDDLFDSDTVYDIELWDCVGRRRLGLYTRTHTVGAGGESGKPVSGVCFDEQDRLWIRFQDGTREPAELPPASPPPRG